MDRAETQLASRKYLTRGMIFFISLAILFTIISLVELRSVIQSKDLIGYRLGPNLVKIEKLHLSLEKRAARLRAVVFSPKRSLIAEFIEKDTFKNEFKTVLKELGQGYLDQKGKGLIAEVQNAEDRYSQAVVKTTETLKHPQTGELPAVYFLKETLPRHRKLEDSLARLRAHHEFTLTQALRESNEGASGAMRMMILLGGIFVTLTAAMTAMILSAFKARRKAENQLQESESKNEKQFRVLAEGIPQIVWSANQDGVVDYYNQRWFQYIGQSIGIPIDRQFASVIHPEDYESTKLKWNEAFEKGQEFEAEYRIKNREEKYRWHLDRCFPLRNEQGAIVKWLGTATDIHRRKEIEEDLARSIQVREELIAVVSHDLKNPLQAIALNAELLAQLPAKFEKPRQNEIWRFSMISIEKSVHLMSRLISDLLDFAKIESGSLKLDKKLVNLDSVLQESVDFIRPLAEKKKISISFHGCTEASTVDCDQDRISQVVLNLLGNAVKFTPPDGFISIECGLTETELTIKVRDTGPGIPGNYLEHIFDRFWQGQTVHRQGVGLGLAISKGIIESHGGKIWVESQVNVGSTFYFSVPLAESERKQIESSRSIL